MTATKPKIPPRLPGEPARRQRSHGSQTEPTNPACLIAQTVEARTVGGGLHRGTLVAVSEGWLALELRAGGKALVRLETITSLTTDVFATVARRDAE